MGNLLIIIDHIYLNQTEYDEIFIDKFNFIGSKTVMSKYSSPRMHTILQLNGMGFPIAFPFRSNVLKIKCWFDYEII